MRLPISTSVRRSFWESVAAGTPLKASGIAAGVSENTAKRWFRNAGGVNPRLEEPKRDGPRPRLNLAERIIIEVGITLGKSIRIIASELDRAPSTIKREIDVNSSSPAKAGTRKSGYRRKHRFGARQSGSTAHVRRYTAITAQQRSDQRARRPKPTKLDRNPQLRETVQTHLDDNHSPEQISGALRLEFPDNPEMQVSHETIYKAVYLQGRGALRRELATCLRTGRALRKPTKSVTRTGKFPDVLTIADRPAEVDDRAVPGHWEGDLILGKDNGSAIGTLVERTSGFVLLLHLPDNHTAHAVADAAITKMGALPEILRRTLTWDRGSEMAQHARITMATGIDIYFCDPHSPWQRGSNENTNGLLRQYFPKGTELSGYPADYLDYVAMQLNTRPRKRHGFRTPIYILDQILSNQSSVASTA